MQSATFNLFLNNLLFLYNESEIKNISRQNSLSCFNIKKINFTLKINLCSHSIFNDHLDPSIKSD